MVLVGVADVHVSVELGLGGYGVLVLAVVLLVGVPRACRRGPRGLTADESEISEDMVSNKETAEDLV